MHASAYVICGFELKDRAVHEQEQVTRYNEITGHPYTATLGKYLGQMLILNDKPIDVVVECEDELFCGAKHLGLEILQDGFEGGQKYLAVEVAKVSIDDCWSQLLPTLEIPESVAAVARQYNVQPRWYLMMTAG